MAVVFISAKQRQKMFFMAITIMFVLFALAISLGIFLAKPKEVPVEVIFYKPKVNIKTEIFDSDQFKALQGFSKMQLQYSYVATTKAGKQQTGTVSATSIEEARSNLEEAGLNVTKIEEVQPGRDNPFTPYYVKSSSGQIPK